VKKRGWTVLATVSAIAALAGGVLAPAGQAQGRGLRYCERPGRAGDFLAASPNVSCRTARRVRRRLFEDPCQSRTFCFVLGFGCHSRQPGARQAEPFFISHHATCRSPSKSRRIVLDIG
jgi:hypothetical protein